MGITFTFREPGTTIKTVQGWPREMWESIHRSLERGTQLEGLINGSQIKALGREEEENFGGKPSTRDLSFLSAKVLR